MAHDISHSSRWWEVQDQGTCREQREELLSSLIRALIPCLNHFPKAPPPNTILLGVRNSTSGFWGGYKQGRRGQTSSGLVGHTEEFEIDLEGTRKPLKMPQCGFLLENQ